MSAQRDSRLRLPALIPTFGRSDSVLKAGAGVIHF
jgi:hypothetical protein